MALRLRPFTPGDQLVVDDVSGLIMGIAPPGRGVPRTMFSVDAGGLPVSPPPRPQPKRQSTFNLAASDTGSIIPCDGTFPVNLLAAAELDPNFYCELLILAGSTITLSAGAGTVLVVAGSTAPGSISSSVEGSSLIVRGSGTLNRFYGSVAA